MKPVDQSQTFTRRQVLGLLAAGTVSLVAPALLAKELSLRDNSGGAYLINSTNFEDSDIEPFVLSF